MAIGEETKVQPRELLRKPVFNWGITTRSAGGKTLRRGTESTNLADHYTRGWRTKEMSAEESRRGRKRNCAYCLGRTNIAPHLGLTAFEPLLIFFF